MLLKELCKKKDRKCVLFFRFPPLRFYKRNAFVKSLFSSLRQTVRNVIASLFHVSLQEIAGVVLLGGIGLFSNSSLRTSLDCSGHGRSML